MLMSSINMTKKSIIVDLRTKIIVENILHSGKILAERNLFIIYLYLGTSSTALLL